MPIKKLCKQYGIAITGGVASGKSSLTSILKSLGYFCVDADQLARECVQVGSPGLAKIVKHFGPDFLNEDGSLNRRKLRGFVFTHPEARKALESITHPEIRKLLERKLEEEGLVQAPHLWFYEAALIIEAGLAKDFREVWLVVSDPQIQAARLQKRDALPEEEAFAMIRSQMTDEEKEKVSDVVIENHDDLEGLSVSVQQALEALKDRMGL